jgi:hypothetical protein
MAHGAIVQVFSTAYVLGAASDLLVCVFWSAPCSDLIRAECSF